MNRRQQDNQNMIIVAILSVVVLLYWDYFIEAPRQRAEIQALKEKKQQEKLVQAQTDTGTLTVKARTELLSESPRVAISSPSLHGSLALKGLRIDDLTLARYRETLEKDSPEVTLLSPAGDPEGYFAEFGWASADKTLNLPGPDTVWTADAKSLDPKSPVTLTWKNPQGITFKAAIALDGKYLFTVTQSAAGPDGKALNLQTYSYVNREWDAKKHPALGVVHEGPVGVFDHTLKETPYKKLTEEKEQTFETADGWLGISDKYWLSALIPADIAFTAHFSHYVSHGRDHYQADALNAAALQTTTRLFAGAKELNLLDAYGEQYHIPLFQRAVDFGFFYWLAEPLFRLLEWFHALVGNFGVAILLLTVLVKAIMYPLASKSFASMNQMKAVQPKMKAIQDRYKGDKLEMNKAIMELYKKEKVNPASGCLPMVIQIPVFLSLYKVLYVTLEMRHAPFFGWIHDLSAPDPTNLFTLFGTIPWTAPIWLHLGIWPMLMCVTMIVQQRQSPPPTDPAQAKMMKLLPFFFLFLFSNVAAGLVIYWTWSNTLSILQQWHIRHSFEARKRR